MKGMRSYVRAAGGETSIAMSEKSDLKATGI